MNDHKQSVLDEIPAAAFSTFEFEKWKLQQEVPRLKLINNNNIPQTIQTMTQVIILDCQSIFDC